MKTKPVITRKTLSIIGCLLGWFAVVGQLVLIIMNRQADVFETLIRFLSYFTILTYILVALYFTSQIVGLNVLNFLRNNSALLAITTFILIVGLVYQIVLRAIWQPSGFQMLIDELLHSVIPVYVLMYWFLYINRLGIIPLKLLGWLLFPFGYFVLVMIRGYVSNYYPYPFIDVSIIGYVNSFTNFIMLTLFALFLMGGLYVTAKYILKND